MGLKRVRHDLETENNVRAQILSFSQETDITIVLAG